MAQTALGEKLQRSGFIPREVRFSVAIAEFLNTGGTIERAYELIAVAADKMGSGGQSSADKAPCDVPPASHWNGDEGQYRHANEAAPSAPSSPPNRDGSGRPVGAIGHSAIAAPAREPSLSPQQIYARTRPRVEHGHFAGKEPSDADRAAMIAFGRDKAIAMLSVFDRYKVRDGRPLKKLRFHELMKLAQEDETESRAFRYMVAEVESRVANPDRMALVTDLVSAEVAEKAFAFAKVAANAQ